MLWWPLTLTQILQPVEFQRWSITVRIPEGRPGVNSMVGSAPTGTVTITLSHEIFSPVPRVTVAPSERWSTAVTGVFRRMGQRRSAAMFSYSPRMPWVSLKRRVCSSTRLNRWSDSAAHCLAMSGDPWCGSPMYAADQYASHRSRSSWVKSPPLRQSRTLPWSAARKRARSSGVLPLLSSSTCRGSYGYGKNSRESSKILAMGRARAASRSASVPCSTRPPVIQ